MQHADSTGVRVLSSACVWYPPAVSRLHGCGFACCADLRRGVRGAAAKATRAQRSTRRRIRGHISGRQVTRWRDVGRPLAHSPRCSPLLSSVRMSHTHPAGSPAKVAKRTPASSPASDAPASATAAGSAAGGSGAARELISLDEDGMSDDNTTGKRTAAAVSTPTTNGAAPGASAAASSASSSPASHHVSLTPSFTSASFDYVDRASINKYLLCHFCTAPFWQPIEHTCRMAFCTRCVSAGAAVACPECGEVVKPGKNTQSCSKITERQLDELEIQCRACEKRMTRKDYESHWRDACPIACPFAGAGCAEMQPRSNINAHIDSCSFAPVQCEASTFGCTWSGHREAQAAHAKDCAWVACLPSFQALQRAHRKATEDLTEENKRLRIALTTREGQLQSHLALHKGGGGSVAAPSDAPLYPAGTVLDVLDTEHESVLARMRTLAHAIAHPTNCDSAPSRAFPLTFLALCC